MRYFCHPDDLECFRECFALPFEADVYHQRDSAHDEDGNLVAVVHRSQAMGMTEPAKWRQVVCRC